jgi:hypothetical protein
MDVSNEMPPDLNTTLDNLKKEIFSTLNCCQIGKIKSVDTSAGTVQINLQIKRVAQDGTSTAIPVLTDCPYFVLQGGGAYIDMPIKVDDYCIVLFSDRDIDNWWKSGNQTDPATNRKHHLSDGIAIVGIAPKTGVLKSDGSLVRVLGTSGNDGSSIALAARKDDAIKSTSSEDSTFWAWISNFINVFSSWTPVSEDGGAALKTLMTSFISANPTPSSITGKITGSSSEVKIG